MKSRNVIEGASWNRVESGLTWLLAASASRLLFPRIDTFSFHLASYREQPSFLALANAGTIVAAD